MTHIVLSLLTVARLLGATTALAQPQDPATDPSYEADVEAENHGDPLPPPLDPSSATSYPSQTPTSTLTAAASHTSGYGDNMVEKDSTCVNFIPPDNQATDSMCQHVCGDAVAKQAQNGNTGSTMCKTFIPTGAQDPTVTKADGMHSVRQNM